VSRSNLFFGLVLIGIGTLLLLDQFDMVDGWAVLAEWWPVIVMIVGLGQLVIRPRNAIGGLLLVAVGGVLLLWTLGIVEGIGLLWPVVLIVVGAWLLFGRRSAGASVGPGVDVVAFFDDRWDVASGTFRGGEIVTIFGDADYDLRDVTPEDDELDMQITTIFGDVDLTIPETWDVRVSGPEMFGDVNLHGRTRTDAPEVLLRIHVVTIFGDVDITTAAPRSLPAAALR
jgi:hypothetical protein